MLLIPGNGFCLYIFSFTLVAQFRVFSSIMPKASNKPTFCLGWGAICVESGFSLYRTPLKFASETEGSKVDVWTTTHQAKQLAFLEFTSDLSLMRACVYGRRQASVFR